MTFTSTINTFNDFLPLQTAAPPPVDKVHAPPKVKSWLRHCLLIIYWRTKCNAFTLTT